MTPWREGRRQDVPGVTAVYNHFIETSMATYLEEPVDETWAEQFMARARVFYVLEKDTEILGFASLNPYREMPAYDITATLTYFILPQATGQGLGTQILNRMERDARRLGIKQLLAHISSENPQSLAFHARRGFTECGRFHRIGKKWRRPFDVVWVQKSLDLPGPDR